jgi:hypothetical protein
MSRDAIEPRTPFGPTDGPHSGVDLHHESDGPVPRATWSRCALCGLGLGRVDARGPIPCVGCKERLELELSQGLATACQRCGRHPDLCVLSSCVQSAKGQLREANAESACVDPGIRTTNVAWIALDDIIEPPPSGNARPDGDKASIAELAASLRAHGFLHPVGVRRMGSAYMLIYGQRRVQAARNAGLHQVPCTIHVANDERA